MLDFPGKTACVVFTPGCNLRCGYCHNPEFVLPEKIKQLKGSFIPPEVFFAFLRQRRHLLEGVVVSGGEPTMAPDLIDFMRAIKELGFLVKLDTNGNRPDVLVEALRAGVVDYVALDVKTSLGEYKNLTGPMAVPEHIQKSIALLVEGDTDFEFRSTLIKEKHTPAVIADMVAMVRGAKRVFLQTFRSGITLDPVFGSYHAFDSAEMEAIAEQFRSVVPTVVVRS